MKITMALAKRIMLRPEFQRTPRPTWEQARDLVDMATGGELDTWQLDTLTDWVQWGGTRDNSELPDLRPSQRRQ